MYFCVFTCVVWVQERVYGCVRVRVCWGDGGRLNGRFCLSMWICGWISESRALCDCANIASSLIEVQEMNWRDEALFDRTQWIEWNVNLCFFPQYLSNNETHTFDMVPTYRSRCERWSAQGMAGTPLQYRSVSAQRIIEKSWVRFRLIHRSLCILSLFCCVVCVTSKKIVRMLCLLCLLCMFCLFCLVLDTKEVCLRFEPCPFPELSSCSLSPWYESLSFAVSHWCYLLVCLFPSSSLHLFPISSLRLFLFPSLYLPSISPTYFSLLFLFPISLFSPHQASCVTTITSTWLTRVEIVKE